MKKTILVFLILGLSIANLEGCTKTSAKLQMDHSKMNPAQMDHSQMAQMTPAQMAQMNQSEMDKPVPDTKNMKEVSQRQISNSVSYWYNQNIKGNHVKVAVLDTGIDISNKDLSYKKGINFVGANKNNFNDDHGHGTKISGIIGARENNYNLLGIAPESELYIAKVADKNGNVKIEDLVKGINWAVSQKVDVINISLEFPKGSKELQNAVANAYKQNIIVISSCGNINYPGDTSSAYPGVYPKVISVGMLNTDGKIYSNEFKQKKVDVFAPGEDIFSTYLNNKMTLDTGVSFATAYTTGYTALLIQQYKGKKTKYDREMIKGDLKKYLESKM